MRKELFFKVVVFVGIISITLSSFLTPPFSATVTVTAAVVCVLCGGAYLFFPAEREKTKRLVISYSAAAVTSAAASYALPQGAALAVIAIAAVIAFIAGRVRSGEKVVA